MAEISRQKDGMLILEWGGRIYELSDSLSDAFHQGRASILLEVLEDFIRQSVRCSACDGTGSMTSANITAAMATLPELEIMYIDCPACDGQGRVANAI